MAKLQELINLLEQIGDSTNDNIAPSSKEFTDRLLKDLNIKPKIGKAKPLPNEEVIKIIAKDGEEVRDEYDQDWTEGGNFAAYPEFVPEDEIWWEEGHPLEGNLANIAHEFIERLIMLYLGWDYDSAHALCANPVEAIIRWAARQTSQGSEEEQESGKE